MNIRSLRGGAKYFVLPLQYSEVVGPSLRTKVRKRGKDCKAFGSLKGLKGYEQDTLLAY